MMQEMLKGVGNNSTTSTPTTLTNNNNNNNNNNDNNLESSSRQKLRCPRCNSNNTKFCYYNNYNLTQPRHFCKSCRRYWTKGGTLRNVPIGGGCRKNKSPNVTAKAKAVLSTEMLLNGENKHNPVGFLGPGLLDRVPHHSELQLSGPTPVWPPLLPGHNSSIIALLKGATHFFPNSISSTATNTISSNIDTLGLHLDMYSNGAPTLFGSYPKSNDNPTHLLNEFGLFDETQRLKTLGNYSSYSSDENQRDAILGNLMTTSSSARANLEESGGNLVSYGLKNLETSCWSQFS